MGLDLRIPIGLMFILLGPILLVTGLVNGTEINTWTGGAMSLFGALMLLFAWLGARAAKA